MSSLLAQGPIFLISLIFIMGIVVVVHELGHYLAGRWFGAAAESFSVGFGKPIFERKDKRNTRWRVNWIPLGGFVKFVGESQLPNDVGRMEKGPIGKAYPDLSVGARSIVALAGPLANFVFASLLFALFFIVQGSARNVPAFVSVAPDSPAAEAGLLAGDIPQSINGNPVLNTQQLLTEIQLSGNAEITFEVLRDGEVITIVATPTSEVAENAIGQTVRMGKLGVALQTVEIGERQHYGLFDGLAEGVVETWRTIDRTVTMLGRMITGKESVHQLSGPVAIGDVGRRVFNIVMSNEAETFGQKITRLSWVLVQLCALISVGIGFFNLLPFPVLDGGHLVFNAYEAVTGKVASAKIQEVCLTFGLVLLLGLFAVITWGDLFETGVFKGMGG